MKARRRPVCGEDATDVFISKPDPRQQNPDYRSTPLNGAPRAQGAVGHRNHSSTDSGDSAGRA